MPSTNLIVGLTGGIGSGKSTVARLFANLGVPIIDTDLIAHDLTEPGKHAFHTIVKQFDQITMSNGQLNRRLLRQLIFSDPEKRYWLEELLHPLIREEVLRQLSSLEAPYCIVVIPLYFENSPDPVINRVLVVDTDEALQIARVAKRDVHSVLEIEAIMATQVSRKVRLDGADDIIFNTQGPEFLVPQVEELHKSYLAIAKELQAEIKG
ncbi:MAG: dephospho-CoA kinase [Pseudomonadota bacterium]